MSNKSIGEGESLIQKQLIFLDFYEDMSYKEFQDLARELQAQNRLTYDKILGKYKYSVNGCSGELTPTFTDSKLEYITLENVDECLLSLYTEKYDIELIEKIDRRLNSIERNPDYNPYSKYIYEKQHYPCDCPSDISTLESFEQKIKKNDNYISAYNDLPEKEVSLNEGNLQIKFISTVEIPENSFIYGYSYQNNLPGNYMNIPNAPRGLRLGAKGTPKQFYMKTRSRYRSKYRLSIHRKRPKFKIKYQTTSSVLELQNEQLSRSRELRNEAENEKRKADERKKQALNEI